MDVQRLLFHGISLLILFDPHSGSHLTYRHKKESTLVDPCMKIIGILFGFRSEERFQY